MFFRLDAKPGKSPDMSAQDLPEAEHGGPRVEMGTKEVVQKKTEFKRNDNLQQEFYSKTEETEIITEVLEIDLEADDLQMELVQSLEAPPETLLPVNKMKGIPEGFAVDLHGVRKRQSSVRNSVKSMPFTFLGVSLFESSSLHFVICRVCTIFKQCLATLRSSDF